MTKEIVLPIRKCNHCGYEWIPRIPNPKKCPNCGNTLTKSEVEVIERDQSENISGGIEIE